MTNQERGRKPAARPHWQVVEEALAGPTRRRRQRRRAATPAATVTTLPTVYVTDEMALRTADLLARPRAGLWPPGTVFWLGLRCGARACVTTLIIPEDASGNDAGGDAVLASAVANDEIFSAVVGASLVYLGQVRSRPALTRQPSPTAAPDADGRYEGALCIELAPAAGGKPGFVLEDCLVWRQVAGERRQIAADELAAHLRLIPAFKDLRKRHPPNGPNAR